MFSKSIFTFLILGLLTLAKVNGYVENNYTGKCNDTYIYLEGQGKIENFVDCKMNDKGEVTGLQLYGYCFENEELETVLSYKTIETLEFKWLDEYYYKTPFDEVIISQFGCASPPTNYTVLSTLTNLKYLDLVGLNNTDDNIIANIPKSVEVLNIGGMRIPKDFELTQNMVKTISKLTNLTSLGIYNTVISDKLDFSKFKNLKNLTSLLIDYSNTDYSHHIRNIQKNMFKYFDSLKKLVVVEGEFNQDSLNSISNLTNLEELVLDYFYFEGNGKVSFYELRKLKKLTSLYIDNRADYSLLDIFYLTSLKRLTKISDGDDAPISSSKDKSITWANLKNLEFLRLINMYYKDGIEEFDFKYLGGDLPNLKEVYLLGTGYSTIPESIENLKNLEVLGVPFSHLDSIPKSIGNLEKLRVLDLSWNDLTSIPEEIGKIKDLVVFLDYNELENKPDFIKYFGETFEEDWGEMYYSDDY